LEVAGFAGGLAAGVSAAIADTGIIEISTTAN
jgi:hypothetical protein